MNIFIKGLVADVLCKRLYEENRIYIEKRFPKFYVDEMQKLFEDIHVSEDNGDLSLAKNGDCIYICTIAEGGVFAALWAACETAGMGCEVDLELIPVRQELIEITELFEENPYEAESSGFIILSEKEYIDGAKLIGHTTENNDRIIVNRDNKRFLTPPARQKKDIEKRESDGKSRKNFAKE